MTADTYQSWLASLKVGDRVLVGWGDCSSMNMWRQVKKASASVITAGEYKFSRRTGREIGKGTHRLGIPCEEEIVAMERYDELLWLAQVDLHPFTCELPLPTLQAIHKLIEESKCSDRG